MSYSMTAIVQVYLLNIIKTVSELLKRVSKDNSKVYNEEVCLLFE